MGGGASPGVDIVTWPQILRVIWLTAAFEAVLILLVFLHDASVISAARRRAATAAERSEKARAHLLFTPAGRAEPLRVHLASLLHPFHSIIGHIIEGTDVAFGVGELFREGPEVGLFAGDDVLELLDALPGFLERRDGLFDFAGAAGDDVESWDEGADLGAHAATRAASARRWRFMA